MPTLFLPSLTWIPTPALARAPALDAVHAPPRVHKLRTSVKATAVRERKRERDRLYKRRKKEERDRLRAIAGAPAAEPVRPQMARPRLPVVVEPTYDLTAALMGDPPYSRSALAQREKEHGEPSHEGITLPRLLWDQENGSAT